MSLMFRGWKKGVLAIDIRLMKVSLLLILQSEEWWLFFDIQSWPNEGLEECSQPWSGRQINGRLQHYAMLKQCNPKMRRYKQFGLKHQNERPHAWGQPNVIQQYKWRAIAPQTRHLFAFLECWNNGQSWAEYYRICLKLPSRCRILVTSECSAAW